MKAKFMAMALTIGLSLTGFAATAHAEGYESSRDLAYAVVQDGGCDVHSWYVGTQVVSYEDVGVIGHYKRITTIYLCRVEGCDAIDSVCEEIFEDHTLRMAAFGPVWECCYCDYYEVVY